jgi:hypothetical protein
VSFYQKAAIWGVALAMVAMGHVPALGGHRPVARAPSRVTDGSVVGYFGVGSLRAEGGKSGVGFQRNDVLRKGNAAPPVRDLMPERAAGNSNDG